MRDLSGRRALITGASGGLGRFIAREFAAAGVDLALTGRDHPRLDDVAGEARARGRAAVATFTADLITPGAAEELAATVESTVGPVDIVINNAGAEIAASYTAYSPDEVSELITLDLVAPLLLIKAVLPGMLARRHGQVVNICSLASKGPLPYGVPYSAAKSGLAMATQSLRLEYAGSGVGFSAVLPGFVTQAGIFARHQRSGATLPPLIGATTPEEVGSAVLRAVQTNAAEIVVAPPRMRWLLTLTGQSPHIPNAATGWLGVTATARAVAARNGGLDNGRPACVDPAGGR